MSQVQPINYTVVIRSSSPYYPVREDIYQFLRELAIEAEPVIPPHCFNHGGQTVFKCKLSFPMNGITTKFLAYLVYGILNSHCTRRTLRRLEEELQRAMSLLDTALESEAGKAWVLMHLEETYLT